MLSRLWGGRRADAFQDAVDGHVELSGNELSKFVDLAHTVREIPAVRLDSETRVAMRARLVAEAESVLASDPTPARYAKPRKHKALRAAVGVTVVLGALSGGVVSVSANALPGDMLYPVKLGVERFELTLNGDPAEAGRARFEHATTRLDEAEQLARSGNTEGVTGALGDFTDEADAGSDQLLRAFAADSDAASITAIRTFTHSSAAQLASIAAQLDESRLPAYTNAVSAITAIDKRAIETCPACTDEAPIDIPYNVEPEGGDNSYALPPIMLPELDDRFFDDRKQELPDGVLTDPQIVPRDTELPDRDDLVPPPDDSDDENDSNDSRPLRPEQGKDRDSSPRDHSRPDSDKNDGDILDLPDLPTDEGGSANDLPAPKLDQLPQAIDGLLKKLGPLGTLDDLLGPLLDNNNGKKGTKNNGGPLSQLLGPLLGDDSGPQGKNNDNDGGTLGGLLGTDKEQDDSQDDSDSGSDNQDPDVLEPDSGNTDQDQSEQQQPDVIEPEQDETEEDSGTLEPDLGGLNGTDNESSDLNDDRLPGGTQ